MHFSTKNEHKAFSRAIVDKNPPFLPSKVLYWLVIRSGEAPALTPART